MQYKKDLKAMLREVKLALLEADVNYKIVKGNFNIEDISTHSLRHTFGTRCVEGGMRDVALQRLMGHGSVSATLDNYVFISESYTESELEKMYDYFIKNNIMTN